MNPVPAPRAARPVPRVRIVGTVAMAAVCAAGLAGCSNAASITCSDYGSRSANDQSSVVRDLITGRDLDWTSNAYATVDIEMKIDAYCGISSIGKIVGTQGGATRNQSSSINNAINWDDYTNG